MCQSRQYRSIFRLLNETGRTYGTRPGVAPQAPKMVREVLASSPLLVTASLNSPR